MKSPRATISGPLPAKVASLSLDERTIIDHPLASARIIIYALSIRKIEHLANHAD